MDSFCGQNIEYFSIKDLVLWTENPRDPIDESASDQDVVDRALSDPRNKWDLANFAKSMGDSYDYSELPTVVYRGSKPVVYDGNRRIALGKIKFGLVNHIQVMDLTLPEYPEKIPCNVCTHDIALKHILRKHGSNGSWNALEREKFLKKYFGEESPFLVVDEALGVISSNEALNQDFVKKEIFTDKNLKLIGLRVEKGKLFSKHSDEENGKIFENIASKIAAGEISTRKNRGQIVLDDEVRTLIKNNETKAEHIVEQKIIQRSPLISKERVTKRIAKNEDPIFGVMLSLKSGQVNNLYRDVCELYSFWREKKQNPNPSKRLSQTFPSLIRMSLRLLVETAANDENLKIDSYLKKYFEDAKKNLTSEQRNSLFASCSGVDKVIALLQMGAHNYEASSNVDQTLALSNLIGKMLLLSHSKGECLWTG